MLTDFGYFGDIEETGSFIDFLKREYDIQPREDNRYEVTLGEVGSVVVYEDERRVRVLIETGVKQGSLRRELINLAKKARRKGLDVWYWYPSH